MTEQPLTRDGLLSIAAEPGRWKLVCSDLPVEDRPVLDAQYGRWGNAHVHRHSHKEILICFEGETFERFVGQDYRCRPGSVFLIASNEEHANGYPQDGRSFTHLWISGLDTGVVASFYCQRGGKVVEQRRMTLAPAQAECELLARCWGDVRHPAPWMSHAVLRTALASALYAVVFRAMGSWFVGPDGDTGPERRREIIGAVQRHIAAHLDKAENLDTLAHLSGYSKFHFARIFKECSGQTVHGFVDACRATKARELARHGLPGKEIACALGFSCPAAFSNWLRKNRTQVRL